MLTSDSTAPGRLTRIHLTTWKTSMTCSCFILSRIEDIAQNVPLLPTPLLKKIIGWSIKIVYVWHKMRCIGDVAFQRWHLARQQQWTTPSWIENNLNDRMACSIRLVATRLTLGGLIRWPKAMSLFVKRIRGNFWKRGCCLTSEFSLSAWICQIISCVGLYHQRRQWQHPQTFTNSICCRHHK